MATFKEENLKISNEIGEALDILHNTPKYKAAYFDDRAILSANILTPLLQKLINLIKKHKITKLTSDNNLITGRNYNYISDINNTIKRLNIENPTFREYFKILEELKPPKPYYDPLTQPENYPFYEFDPRAL